jgi:hypothetical protein
MAPDLLVRIVTVLALLVLAAGSTIIAVAFLYQCQGETRMVRSAAHGDPTVALV